MLKILEIIHFEIIYHLRKPSTWIIFFTIVGLNFLVLTEIIDYSRTIGGVILNAPITIAEITGYSNLFGLLLVAAVVGHGSMRDFQTRMSPLIFTTSITKGEYLLGRLCGLYAVSALLIIAVMPLSFISAHFLLNIEDNLYGPFRLRAFTDALFLFTLPNVLISTSLAFAATIYFRNLMGAYLGVLIFFICTLLGSSSLDQWQIAGIIDPSGRVILDFFRMSLPPIRMNLEMVDFSYLLAANRILWISLSLLIFTLASKRFSFSEFTTRQWFSKKKRNRIESSQTATRRTHKILQVTAIFNRPTKLYQLKYLSLQIWKRLILSRTGAVLLVAGLIFIFLIPEFIEGPYEIAGIPTTEIMITLLKHPVIKSIITFFIIIFSGQIIWKEKDYESDEIVNSTPVSNTIFLLSKFVAVGLLIATLLVLIHLACILFQFISRTEILNINNYILFFISEFISYWIFAAAVFFIHVLINQKILSNFLSTLLFLYTLRPDFLGIEYKLWIYGAHSGLGNSQFYSQGSFLGPWILYNVYWSGWALFLLLLSIQLWNRGNQSNYKERFRKSFLKLRSSRWIFFPLAISLITGVIIYYNTHIINEFLSSDKITDRKVLYEKLYGKYRNLPQPHLTGTDLKVELYPKLRSATIEATYFLRNSTGKSIEAIHITTMTGVKTSNVKFNSAGIFEHKDAETGYLIFKLREPMKAGSQIEMNFRLEFDGKGFLNSGPKTSIMNNGSLINNIEWFPAIGYQEERELFDNYTRKKLDLPGKENLISYDSSKLFSRKGQETISFEAIIGTSADQTAVAPGQLNKKWKENDRNYFHYKSNKPILNLYSIYSAQYQIQHSSWNNVLVDIYHHSNNKHNLKQLEEAAKATLSYGDKNFGSYPFSQLKFVEYPDPGTGAFALPGVIEYSPRFVLHQSEKGNLDLVFAAASHEVGHQWWGHKILPAPVAGSAFLIESLAWYTSFGAIESRYGPNHLNKLLNAMKQEYLNPRSKAGTPLLLTNNEFQAYRKGPLSMYALREYIGEKKINSALNHLIKKFESGEPPYPTSYDLYQELKKVTPDSLQYLLKDLLEENTYWSLSTTSSKVIKKNQTQWSVTLEVFVKKITADTRGLETEKTVADYIEIGIFRDASNSKPLYLKRHKLVSGHNLITIIVDEKPGYAGVDPRNLLIDTEIENNMRSLY